MAFATRPSSASLMDRNRPRRKGLRALCKFVFSVTLQGPLASPLQLHLTGKSAHSRSYSQTASWAQARPLHHEVTEASGRARTRLGAHLSTRWTSMRASPCTAGPLQQQRHSRQEQDLGGSSKRPPGSLGSPESKRGFAGASSATLTGAGHEPAFTLLGLC